jgi:hypothetical protein
MLGYVANDPQQLRSSWMQVEVKWKCFVKELVIRTMVLLTLLIT